jgi:2-keto-4-pentenoate hydratase/2-oxohepta-3-ene-1,7-dioic acid hydratase in catechol pathway
MPTMPRKWRDAPEPAPDPDPHTLGLKAWHFIKASRSLADPGATVKISGVSKEADWEVELAAVIGRPAKNVSREKALSYVAGYTAANDLSARDRGRRPGMSETSIFKSDWTKHKTFEGACPLGPWIVPASDIGDPQNLGLKLWVNDGLKQDSNTKDMIFNLAEQIEQLSDAMTLHRATGPDRHAGGSGSSAREIQTGRRGEIWVEKIGTLTKNRDRPISARDAKPRRHGQNKSGHDGGPHMTGLLEVATGA